MQHTLGFQHFAPLRAKISKDFTFTCVVTTNGLFSARKPKRRDVLCLRMVNFTISSSERATNSANSHSQVHSTVSRVLEKSNLNDGGGEKRRVKAYGGSRGNEDEDEDEDEDDDSPLLMDDEEREDWRRKIMQVIDNNPNVEEEVDPVERNKKMQKLLADYPLVVDEDDPDWPEDADGWGFNLGQFFNKISIKNVKKDDDDEDSDSENKVVWQDDDYIRPIKDITSMEWEETVFKDISPLIVFIHNRYKRPKENEKMRDELEKAVNIIWNCRLPSPRCVAIDGVVELDLVSALQVSVFPELIFTKAGKILYREKGNRTADELSKIMAFFYYGAAKPPSLNTIGKKNDEAIPSLPSEMEEESQSSNPPS